MKVAGRDVPAPKRTRFVSPVFPPAAQAAGQRGIVILELVIDERGQGDHRGRAAQRARRSTRPR